MTLTNDDLLAIHEMIVAAVKEHLAPLHETQKQLLKTQIAVVEDINYLKLRVDTMAYNTVLPPSSHELRKALKDLEKDLV